MAKKLLFLAIVLAVAAAFATGLLTWGDVRHSADQAKYAVNRQTYRLKGRVASMNDAPTAQAIQAGKTCRDNLMRIQSAKKAIAENRGNQIGTVSRDDIARKLGGHFPSCPWGGEYYIGTLEQNPRCSIGGAGTPSREDDHLIANY